MLGTDLECHKTKCARTGKWLEYTLAPNDLREVQQMVHQSTLRASQPQDPQLVRLLTNLGTYSETVRKMVDDIISANVMSSLEQIGN